MVDICHHTVFKTHRMCHTKSESKCKLQTLGEFSHNSHVGLGLFFVFFNLTLPARGIFSCSMKTLSCGMWNLVHQPGIKPGPPGLGALSLSRWTIKEVTQFRFIICNKCAAQLRGVSSKGGCARVEPSGLWGLCIFYFILL